MVLILIVTQSDYGPMYDAEIRARRTGKVVADGSHPMLSNEFDKLFPQEDTKQRAINAIVPIMTLLVTVIAGL